MIKKGVIFTILLVIFCSSVSGAIFVSTTGIDSASCGSSDAPCRHVEYAVEQRAGSGDVVSIGDGTYVENRISVPEGVSMTSTSKDYNKVILKPSSDIGSGWDPFIQMLSSPGSAGDQEISYLTIEGIDGANKARYGISIENRNGVRIHHCRIQDFTGGWANGVKVKGTAADGLSYYDIWPADSQQPGTDTNLDANWPADPVIDFELDHNDIINCGWKSTTIADYISPAVSVFHLKDSSIHDNYFDSKSSLGQPIVGVPAIFWNVDIYNNVMEMGSLYSGLADSNARRSTFPIEIWVMRDGCEIYNNTADAGFSITWGKETTVRDNTIIYPEGRAPYGHDIGIEFMEQSYGLLESNLIYGAGTIGLDIGNGGASRNVNWIREHTTVRNNVLYGTAGQAIVVQAWGPQYSSSTNTIRNMDIYNNVVVGRSGEKATGSIYLFQQDNAGPSVLKDINVKNNIVMDTNSDGVWIKGTISKVIVDHNLFFNNYHDSALGVQDTNTIKTNPNIINLGGKNYGSYALQPPSDAIDGGGDVGLPFSGSAPDIGAIEYGQVVCTPTWSCTDTDCSACVDDQKTCTEACHDSAGCSADTQKQVMRACQSQPTGDPTSNFTSDLVTLDGVADEAGWKDAFVVILDRDNNDGQYPSTASLPGLSDASLSVRSIWDKENIYFFMDVRDDKIISDSPEGELWRDDGVEIYLEGIKNTVSAYQAHDNNLMFSSDGRVHDTKSKGWDSTIQIGKRTTSSGYTLEIAIPWSTIGITPSNNHQMGIAYQLNDDDGGNPDISLFWKGTGEFNTDTNAFRTMELVGFSGSYCGNADRDTDGDVEIDEIIAYINEWKTGNVGISDLMQAIGEWKSGC